MTIPGPFWNSRILRHHTYRRRDGYIEDDGPLTFAAQRVVLRWNENYAEARVNKWSRVSRANNIVRAARKDCFVDVQLVMALLPLNPRKQNVRFLADLDAAGVAMDAQ